jgi:large subunit ribosomal protein L3
VDVSGNSKGRGFAGVVKRHGFRGGPKTHGQSDRHRAPGSIGAGTTPGRVWKGQKMAGRMGGKRITVQNLEVVEVIADRNLILVKGSVPGARNTLLQIRRAVKS